MKLYFNKSEIKFILSVDEFYSEICIKGTAYIDQKILFKWGKH